MYAPNIIKYMHLYSHLWPYTNKFGSYFPLISFTFADKVFYLFPEAFLDSVKNIYDKDKKAKSCHTYEIKP